MQSILTNVDLKSKDFFTLASDKVCRVYTSVTVVAITHFARGLTKVIAY